MRRAARQELPRGAFVTVDQLRSATRIQDEGLRILVLSYGWMTRSHPDPLGENLQRLAGVFALFSRTLGIHGVFWDFASLMQHSAEPDGPRRTDEEEKLFQAGLAASSDFYAHPNTTVLRLTTFPSGYPEKYSDHISTSNSAEYFDRGWCYSEHCWSSLTKSVSKSLDLGHYSGNRTRLYGDNGVLAECTREGARPPPLLPAQFAEELESRSFIDPSNDKPLVISLYTKIFEAKVRPRATFSAPALGTFLGPTAAHGAQMGAVSVLDYQRMGWGDAEAVQLAKVLGSGATPALRTLDISFNPIGNRGGMSIAKAVSASLPGLEVLNSKGVNASQGTLAELRRCVAGRQMAASKTNSARAPPPNALPGPFAMPAAPPLRCLERTRASPPSASAGSATRWSRRAGLHHRGDRVGSAKPGRASPRVIRCAEIRPRCGDQPEMRPCAVCREEEIAPRLINTVLRRCRCSRCAPSRRCAPRRRANSCKRSRRRSAPGRRAKAALGLSDGTIRAALHATRAARATDRPRRRAAPAAAIRAAPAAT